MWQPNQQPGAVAAPAGAALPAVAPGAPLTPEQQQYMQQYAEYQRQCAAYAQSNPAYMQQMQQYQAQCAQVQAAQAQATAAAAAAAAAATAAAEAAPKEPEEPEEPKLSVICDYGMGLEAKLLQNIQQEYYNTNTLQCVDSVDDLVELCHKEEEANPLHVNAWGGMRGEYRRADNMVHGRRRSDFNEHEGRAPSKLWCILHRVCV